MTDVATSTDVVGPAAVAPTVKTPARAGLSADAVPWIVSHLHQVPTEERASLVAALCAQDFHGSGWAGWNRADAHARRSLATLCA